MPKKYFEAFEEDTNDDGDLFKFIEEEKKKPKKKQSVKKEGFGVPIESLFSLSSPQADTIKTSPASSTFNLRKDVPKEVFDCIMDCLCVDCQQKVEKLEESSIFSKKPLPTSLPLPKPTPEVEKQTFQIFEEDEEDDLEDDDNYEDDDEDDEEDDEEFSIVSKEDETKTFENGFEDVEEEENEKDFFSSLEKENGPFKGGGGFKF